MSTGVRPGRAGWHWRVDLDLLVGQACDVRVGGDGSMVYVLFGENVERRVDDDGSAVEYIPFARSSSKPKWKQEKPTEADDYWIWDEMEESLCHVTLSFIRGVWWVRFDDGRNVRLRDMGEHLWWVVAEIPDLPGG